MARGAIGAWFLVSGAILALTGLASADEGAPGAIPSGNARAAEESFRQGQQAAERGEYLTAARAFARADELSPNPLALQAALEVSIQADDAVLGMELVDRATALDGTPAWTPAIAEAVEKARPAFAPRVGKLRIECASCTAVVDRLPFPARKARWVGVGSHQVELAEGRRSIELRVDVAAGAEAVAKMPPAPDSPADERPTNPPDASIGRISPAFFFVGLGLTLASGAGLTASAIDTRNKHDEFEAAGDTDRNLLKEEGEAAQLRTNVLIGVTGGLGLTTTILAIVTDWASLAAKDSAAARASTRVTPFASSEGAGLFIAGRF